MASSKEIEINWKPILERMSDIKSGRTMLFSQLSDPSSYAVPYETSDSIALSQESLNIVTITGYRDYYEATTYFTDGKRKWFISDFDFLHGLRTPWLVTSSVKTKKKVVSNYAKFVQLQEEMINEKII